MDRRPLLPTASQTQSRGAPPKYQSSSELTKRFLAQLSSMLRYIIGLIILALPFYFTYRSYNWATTPLGINCRGDSNCDQKPYIEKLIWQLESIPDDKIYGNNQHIACFFTNPNSKFTANAYCAYVQGTKNGTTGADVKSVMRKVKEHGCISCGSVPLEFPQNNDGTMGRLTFNWRPCACQNRKQGICELEPGTFCNGCHCV